MNSQNAQHEILVVDDEPQVLKAIQDTLEEKFQVFVETSPLQAIKVLRERPELSVILSDQRMPGMPGNEFLARAREFSDATRLMITGYADLGAVIKAVNEGHIFGYISKPWNPDALRLAIVKAVEHYELTRKLSEEQRLLHNLMTYSPDAIFFKDLEHRFVRLNAVEAERLNAARPEDVIGKGLKNFIPQARALELEAEERVIFKNGTPERDRVYQQETRDGSIRWFSISRAPVKDDKGRVVSLVGIARDVTGRHQQEERISRLSRMHQVLSGINTTIVRVSDPDTLFNEACRIAVEHGKFRTAWIGVFDAETGGLKPVAVAGAEEGYLSVMRRLDSGTVSEGEGATLRIQKHKNPVICNDIEREWTESAARAQALQRGYRSTARVPLMVAGEPVGIFTLYSDQKGFFNSEEMKLLEELAGDIAFALDHIEKERRANYLAYYDALTGLPNRMLFVQRADQMMYDVRGEKHGQVGVFVLNLERFRIVNDTMGRHAGDVLLKLAAERIKACLSHPDAVARLGADAFAGAFSQISYGRDVARFVTEKLFPALAKPFLVNDRELRIGARSGIALFPVDGKDAETVLNSAEIALRRAKESGDRYLFYAPDMNARVTERLDIESRLRRAIEEQQFVLHYQPKIELRGGLITGIEALIRWQDPGRGLIAPGTFIAILEETGMILDVGRWALQKAVADYRTWSERGLKPPRIAVNVSQIQLRQKSFVADVKDAIGGGKEIPLELEITESMIMQDFDATTAKLKELRQAGIEIAMDDFGTGYSSLGYLAKLPVNTLKIDRSFIMTMAKDPNSMAIVSAVISLAHSLDFKVTAEGVETEEQRNLLKLLRCDEMQGYLFSRPLPAAELEAKFLGAAAAT